MTSPLYTPQLVSVAGSRPAVRARIARWVAALSAVAAVCLSSAAPALANGSPTITGAPALTTTGQTVTSGWPASQSDNGEFWTVTLNAGDTLSLDTSSASSSQYTCYVSTSVYAPSVTAATFSTATAVATSEEGTTSFTAPSSGTWIVYVSSDDCTDLAVTYNYAASIAPTSGESMNGSATITGAPALVLGRTVSSGWYEQRVNETTGGEFWKVSLTGGQTLSIDIPSEGCQVEVNFYTPSTTDANLPSATAAYSSGQPAQFVAPYSGTWIVFFSANEYDCNTTVAYNYVASVAAAAGEAAHGSATIAGAPALVLGQTVSSGWANQPVDDMTGGEFWTASLSRGQALTITFPDETNNSQQCDGEYVGTDFYAPGVTDATLPSATPLQANSDTYTGTGEQFVAPSSGTWIVFFYGDDYEGCKTLAFNYDASIGSGSGGGGTTTTPSHAGKSQLTVDPQTIEVSPTGRLGLELICSGAPCSGSVTLAVSSRRTTGRGRRRRTRAITTTIGSGSTGDLSVGAHTVTLSLSGAGVRLLRRHHNRLGATATVTDTAGSHPQTSRAAVAVRAAKSTKSAIAAIPIATVRVNRSGLNGQRHASTLVR